MGSTNLTPNYELSQFIGTDKPAWLQDYNGDMLKIDTGIAGAKTAADNAQSTADGAQGDATTALSGIADINTELGTVESVLSTATGNINTINSLIGNGTPTTTDQTIIGAINEINANEIAVRGAVENKFLPYSPRTVHTYTPSGSDSFSNLIPAAIADFLTYVQSLQDNQRVHLNYVQIGDFIYDVVGDVFLGNAATSITIELTKIIVDANGLKIRNIRSSDTSLSRFYQEAIDASGTPSLTDMSSNSFSQNIVFEYAIYDRAELS